MRRPVRRDGVLAPAFASMSTIDAHRRAQAERKARMRVLAPSGVDFGVRMMRIVNAGYAPANPHLDEYTGRSGYANAWWPPGDGGETR